MYFIDINGEVNLLDTRNNLGVTVDQTLSIWKLRAAD